MAVKYVINDETMTQIADPLRSLTGRTDGMTPAEMAAAGAAAHTEVQTQTDLIYQIKMVLNGKAAGGTGKPEQGKTANITENGEHEIVPDEGYTLSKVSVNVNVESSVDTTIEDGLITRTLTEYRNNRVTTIGEGVFYNARGLTDVYFPNVETINTYAFFGSGLTKATPENFPKVKTLSGQVFRTSKITEADFPLVTGTTSDFYGCKQLIRANFPNATTMASFNLCSAMTEFNAPNIKTIVGNGFRGCSKLTKLDFQTSPTLQGYALAECPLLETVIFRGSTVATMSNTTAVLSMPISKGTGYVYVPSALVDSYKAATNWSTYADQIRAIEDYPEITGG